MRARRQASIVPARVFATVEFTCPDSTGVRTTGIGSGREAYQMPPPSMAAIPTRIQTRGRFIRSLMPGVGRGCEAARASGSSFSTASCRLGRIGRYHGGHSCRRIQKICRLAGEKALATRLPRRPGAGGGPSRRVRPRSVSASRTAAARPPRRRGCCSGRLASSSSSSWAARWS